MKKKATGKKEGRLIKLGTPQPGRPSFKLVDVVVTPADKKAAVDENLIEAAGERENEIFNSSKPSLKKIDTLRRVYVPRQALIYGHSSTPKITGKSPRLR